MMYTHDLDPPVRPELGPSRLFGGPERRFVPNIVIPPGDIGATWRPIDGTVGAGELGPMFAAAHVARSVYVSRCVRAVRVLTLAWDTPDTIYVSGGLLPLGWHECRLVTAELLAEVRQRAAEFQAGGAGAVAGGADEWKQAEAAAKVRDLVAAWQESQLPHAAAVVEQNEPVDADKVASGDGKLVESSG